MRGQIFDDLPVDSASIGQEAAEIWTAQADLQPVLHKPGRLLGFTLIEVLVVVVILAILAAVVVPQVMERPGQARQTAAKQGIQSIMTALNMYHLDNFAYPDSNQGLEALVTKPAGLPDGANWRGPYLDNLPKDPWGRPFLYLNPGVHGKVDVYTLGSDGRPGGTDEAADIGNWQE